MFMLGPIIMAVTIAVALMVSPPIKMPHQRVVPSSTVAPEVCEGDGHVAKVVLDGDIYVVTCSDKVQVIVGK